MNSTCIVLLLLLSSSLQAETDSHSAAVDYNNIQGAQIYLFDRSNAFSYLSVDSTSTSQLKATVYLYLTNQLSSLSHGVYTSIGFGTSQMSGSDILLCAVTNGGSQWCKDYSGSREDISESSSVTNVISSSVNNLGAAWSPYVIQIVWQIQRSMDPSSYINGSGSAIYAYGSLNSSGIPQQHPSGYYDSIVTGDGNTGNPPQATTTTSSTTGSTTTDTTISSTTTDPNSGSTADTTSTTTDPNSGSTTTDPNAGSTTTDPNSGSTTTDPNAGSTTTSTTTDPNSGSTTTDPNAGSTTTSTTTDPNSGSTTTSTTTDPNSGSTTTDPNAGSTTTSTATDPNSGSTSTDPNAGSTTTDPNAGSTTTNTNSGATTTTVASTTASNTGATTTVASTTTSPLASIRIVVSYTILLLFLIF